MEQDTVKRAPSGGLKRRRLLTAWLFMIPLVFINLLVILGPSVATVYFSFTEWSGIDPPSSWVCRTTGIFSRMKISGRPCGTTSSGPFSSSPSRL